MTNSAEGECEEEKEDCWSVIDGLQSTRKAFTVSFFFFVSGLTLNMDLNSIQQITLFSDVSKFGFFFVSFATFDRQAVVSNRSVQVWKGAAKYGAKFV